MRIVGALLILVGVALIPVMVIAIVGSGMGMRQGAFADSSLITIILYWVLLLSLGFAVAASCPFWACASYLGAAAARGFWLSPLLWRY